MGSASVATPARRVKVTSIVVPLFALLLALAGCAQANSEAPPTVVPTATVAAPREVKAARAAVLNFLRDGANECVPPAGVHWRTSIGKAPQGFDVYRFSGGDCIMTVSYALPAGADTLYHASLQNTGIGFCWQANVDANGHIVTTGKAAEMLPELANAAAAYCEEQGYRYEIRTVANGTPCGTCVFPDGSVCNAWAFFQEQCEPGAAPAGDG